MTVAPASLVAIIVLAACGSAERRTPSTEFPAGVPDRAVLVCDRDGSRLRQDVVRPQRDGVHVIVDNRLRRDPGVSFRFSAGGGMGENAPPGRTELVLTPPPGTIEAACNPPGLDPGAASFQELEIVDPGGIYVDARLDCVQIVRGIGEYAQIPAGKPDPIGVARKQLSFGLDPGDELRRAGYPESRAPVVVAIRGGDVVASTTLERGEKGWYTSGYEACSGFGS